MSETAGVIAAIFGTGFTALAAFLGWAWWGGAFKARTEAKGDAAHESIQAAHAANAELKSQLHSANAEMRMQIQSVMNRVEMLVVQGVKNERDIMNLQELRKEMLATLDKIFDSLSRGQRG